MKSNRSEPVLELKIKDPVMIDGNGDDTGYIPRPREYVFSLPSEPSTITALIERCPDFMGGDRAYRFEVFYRNRDKIIRHPVRKKRMTMDIEMELQPTSRGIEHPAASEHELTEKDHGPNKDLNLLIAAYHSMNANVFSSNRDFTIPDWVQRDLPQNAIYKQRTPLGNTVLHLAAAYGNNAMVEKVAQHAPYLFTVINNNYDTALHIAARAGHASTIQFLLNAFLSIVRQETNGQDHQSILEMMLMVSLALLRNNQGNTFHEAFMVNSHNGAMIFQAFEASFIIGSSEFEANFKVIVHRLATFAINKEGKSLLYLAIEVGCNQVVNQLMDICVQHGLKPEGKSPIIPIIIKKDTVMLETVLSKKPNWIHLKDEEERFPLHYAASMGYLDGVSYLIKKCASCTLEMDKDGFFPIHLACSKGHVGVVEKLLKWCPDPMEILDKNARNSLHIAAASGKYEVVKYILQHPKLEKMINQKDNDGNTPLHLATHHWHPKIVHALTWDTRVNLALLNQENQTALDMADQQHNQNPSIAQRLTWSALRSAGTPRSSVGVTPKSMKSCVEKETPNMVTSKSMQSCVQKETANIEQYKDRFDTLIVVSTLIITASLAAAFTMPGDVDQGTAVNLNRHMFHLFILSLTISIYGAISTTIILIWAQLGDLRLALFALKCAKPLLGISLMTLSLAFLAGVYLVVSKLTWLATTFVMMSVVLILMIMLLYTLLWLPSSSTSPFIRYISYYPFLMFAMLADGQTDANHKGSTSTSSTKSFKE